MDGQCFAGVDALLAAVALNKGGAVTFALVGPNLGELPIGSAGLAVFRRYQLRQRQSGGGLEKFAAAHGFILHAWRYYSLR